MHSGIAKPWRRYALSGNLPQASHYKSMKSWPIPPEATAVCTLVLPTNPLLDRGQGFAVLEPFCHNYRNMLVVISHLEDPFVTKL